MACLLEYLPEALKEVWTEPCQAAWKSFGDFFTSQVEREFLLMRSQSLA